MMGAKAQYLGLVAPIGAIAENEPALFGDDTLVPTLQSSSHNHRLGILILIRVPRCIDHSHSRWQRPAPTDAR